MRLRLVIPAAIAAAATYVALVRDDEAVAKLGCAATTAPVAAPIPASPVQADVPAMTKVPPVAPPRPRAPVPQSQYVDLAPPPAPDTTTPSVYDLLAGAPLVEAHTPSVADEPAEPLAVDPWQAVPLETLAPVDEPTPVVDIGPAQPAAEPARDAWLVPLDEGRFALGGWAASAGHSMVSAVTFRRQLSEDISADRIVLEIDASENVPDGGLVVLADPGFAPDRDGFTLLLAAAAPGQFSVAGSYRVLPAGSPSEASASRVFPGNQNYPT